MYCKPGFGIVRNINVKLSMGSRANVLHNILADFLLSKSEFEMNAGCILYGSLGNPFGNGI